MSADESQAIGPRPVRVNLAYYRLTHIDPSSGYDQLPRYLEPAANVRLVEPSLPERMPAALSSRLGRSSRLAFYEPAGLRLEYGVLRRLLDAPDEVCHLMYAEDHFNHLAHVRRLPRRVRGTLVATFHQPPDRFQALVRFRSLRRRLRALDAAIVLSREQADFLGELMAPDRVHLVPHGVNAVHFGIREDPAPGPLRLLAVGSWLRDFALLRAVIDRVVAADPSISFEVVTGPKRFDEIAGAPNTTVHAGISSGELLASYREAHVLVHCVTDAAANNALLEAMASGLPIIATRVGGVSDYTANDCAMLTPPSDAEAMAAAILALAHDPQRRARMAKAARARALAFDWQVIARQTLGVYSAALRARATALGRL